MPKPKPGGSKNPKHDPTKDPKTPDDQKKAIHTHLSQEMISLVKVMQMEEELSLKPINRMLGVGGEDLEGYVGQFTNGYKDIDPENPLAKKLAKEKDKIPFLKKVSKEEPWADDTAKAGANHPPTTAKNKK
jgi:hypothetical protein